MGKYYIRGGTNNRIVTQTEECGRHLGSQAAEGHLASKSTLLQLKSVGPLGKRKQRSHGVPALLNYTRPARPASGALAGLSYYGLTLYGSYVHVPVSSILPISHNYVAPQCSPYNGCTFALHPQLLPLPRLRLEKVFVSCHHT